MHDRAAARQRRALRGRPADRRAARPTTSTRCSSPTAAPTAIENAVRMARLHTGRHKVLAAYRSYHGNTATAINADRRPAALAQRRRRAGVVHFFGPYLYRSPFWSTSTEQECERALEHLEQVVAVRGAGDDRGDRPGDRSPAPRASSSRRPATWPASARSATATASSAIADEVMAGFGRTGEWFAVDQLGRPTPDLITFAKGVQLRLRPAGRRGHLRARSPRPSPSGCSPAG